MTDRREPVAWAIWHEGEEAPGRIAYASPMRFLRGTGETRDGEEFIPLYGKPTLTDEEREAIEMAISACAVEGQLNTASAGRQSFSGMWNDRSDALRSLLERTK